MADRATEDTGSSDDGGDAPGQIEQVRRHRRGTLLWMGVSPSIMGLAARVSKGLL
jgi:hypothetical protein